MLLPIFLAVLLPIYLAVLLSPVEPVGEYDLPVAVSKHLAIRQKRDEDDFEGKLHSFL